MVYKIKFKRTPVETGRSAWGHKKELRSWIGSRNGVDIGSVDNVSSGVFNNDDSKQWVVRFLGKPNNVNLSKKFDLDNINNAKEFFANSFNAIMNSTESSPLYKMRQRIIDLGRIKDPNIVQEPTDDLKEIVQDTNENEHIWQAGDQFTTLKTGDQLFTVSKVGEDFVTTFKPGVRGITTFSRKDITYFPKVEDERMQPIEEQSESINKIIATDIYKALRDKPDLWDNQIYFIKTVMRILNQFSGEIQQESLNEEDLSSSIDDLAWSRLKSKFNANDYLVETPEEASINEEALFNFFKQYCKPSIEAITGNKPIKEAKVYKYGKGKYSNKYYGFIEVDKEAAKRYVQSPSKHDVYRYSFSPPKDSAEDKQESTIGYMGNPGDRVVMKPSGIGKFKEFHLSKEASPYDKINMFFSSPEEAKIYADKKGLIIVDNFIEESINEASQSPLLTVGELGPLLLKNPLLSDPDKSAIKRISLKLMADGNYFTEDNLNKLITVYLNRNKAN